MEIGEIIKKARLDRGLTMKEVANYVGVSEAAVSKWESGHTQTIRSDKLYLLAEMLGLSVTSLVMTQNKAIERNKNLDRFSNTMLRERPKLSELVASASDLTDEQIEKIIQMILIMKS